MSEPNDRIIDAMLRLCADRPFDDVTLPAIAEEAGIGLAALAAAFPTRGHILDAFARSIDQQVLELPVADMADEAPRERLFDVLMSRLDALRPHRAAIKTLMAAARRDLALAAGLNAIAVRSQTWMLAAARIDASGWRGRLATQALAVSFARVLRTFVDEDDEGLPRTMAALDKELREGEARHKRFARLVGDGTSDATRRQRRSEANDAAGGTMPGGQTTPSPSGSDDPTDPPSGSDGPNDPPSGGGGPTPTPAPVAPPAGTTPPPAPATTPVVDDGPAPGETASTISPTSGNGDTGPGSEPLPGSAPTDDTLPRG